MAEFQPRDTQIDGGGPSMAATTENVSTKRQRRPSVRLGDIGDQSFDNRRTKQWKPQQQQHQPVKDSGNKSSKTRPLVNLSGGYEETLNGGDEREGMLDAVAIGSWKVKDSKSRRGSTKRVRSNWATKADEGGGAGGSGGGGGEGEGRYSGGEDAIDGGFRDFGHESSDSPLKEQSPIHSLNNETRVQERDVHFGGHRRSSRARVSEGREHNDGVEFDGPSDTDARNCYSAERNGVRVWLNQLGLGRYAPVFEIHEVDDEVLPMLTLEDLKDMGINAVGSRRKIFCAIQKLSKGFS